jgi:hypothetical protein
MKLEFSIVISFLGDKELCKFACESLSDSICKAYDIFQHKDKLTLILMKVRGRMKSNQEAVVYISYDEQELIFQKVKYVKTFDFMSLDHKGRLN